MKVGLIYTFLMVILFASCTKNERVLVMPADKTASKLTIPSSQSTYEAEKGVLRGAVVASNQPGYTGTGFVDFVHASGDYVEFTVNASASGFF